MLELPNLSIIFAKLLSLAAQSNPSISTEKLEGRSFSIAIDELPQDIGIQVINGKILALHDDQIINADVTISGNIKAIIHMIKDEESGLDSDELYINGKISAAKHFQHFLAALSIDWQGFFARFLPESRAGKVADAVEQSLHFAKGGVEQLGKSLTRYIIEDKKLVVTRSEFLSLRNDTEQLMQRIEKLLTQLDKTL